MGESSESSSSFEGPRIVCCSVNTFKCTNFCWGIVCLTSFVFGLVGLFISEGFLLFLDENIYIALTIFGGFSFFVVILGTLGSWAKIEIFFICYIFLMGLLLLAQALAFIFLMLYINDIGTVAEIDDVANGAQERFADQMLDFAEQEPDKWVSFQNQFDCCGISLDTESDDIEIETGDLCSEDEQRAEEDFFCLDVLFGLVNDYIPFIGAGVGLLLFLQLSAIVAACRLYWVPVWRGGWMFDEEELEQLAEEKNIPLPPRAPSGTPSNAFQRVKQAGNRLSFRVQNAMTANPNTPKSAGFLKRLSYNTHNTSAAPNGFGIPGAPPGESGFNGPKPPGAGFGGPPAHARWKRLSAGFQSFGNKMKNTFRPAPPPVAPRIPPPGYAGMPPAGVPRQTSQDDFNQSPRGYRRTDPQMSANRETDMTSLPPAPRFTNTSYEPRGGRVGGSNVTGQSPGGFGQPAPPRYAPDNNRGFGNTGHNPTFADDRSYASSAPSGPPPPSFGNNNGFGQPAPPFGTGGFGGGSQNQGGNFLQPRQPATSPPGGLNAFYTNNNNNENNNGKRKKKRRKRSNNRGRNKARAPAGPPPGNNGGGTGMLMAQIRKGSGGLRPTHTNDRSGPFI